MTDPGSLIGPLRAIAGKAASYIRRERASFSYSSVEMKGRHDLVSHVDKNAEQLIVDDLRGLVPEAGFIVEENTASGKKSMNWIVDPLDGTTNFVHGVPSYGVSIALESEGDILAGVVHEVSRNECFYAWRDGGAYLDDHRIRVSSQKTLSESLVGTGFPVKNFDRLQEFISAVTYFMENTQGVRRIGAASVDLAYLACGRFDAFFEYNLSPWDVAAGALIVKEAGGRVYDFSGGADWLFGREIACTNGLVDEPFLAAIRRCFAG